jgi:hypothetical protein
MRKKKMAIYGCLYDEEKIDFAYTQIKGCVGKAEKENWEIEGLYFDILYNDPIKKAKAKEDITQFVKVNYPKIKIMI